MSQASKQGTRMLERTRDSLLSVCSGRSALVSEADDSALNLLDVETRIADESILFRRTRPLTDFPVYMPRMCTGWTTVRVAAS